MTPETRANIFGLADTISRDAVFFATAAVIMGVGSQNLDATTKNYLALVTLIVLVLFRGNYGVGSIATVLAVVGVGL